MNLFAVLFNLSELPLIGPVKNSFRIFKCRNSSYNPVCSWSDFVCTQPSKKNWRFVLFLQLNYLAYRQWFAYVIGRVVNALVTIAYSQCSWPVWSDDLNYCYALRCQYSPYRPCNHLDIIDFSLNSCMACIKPEHGQAHWMNFFY